MYFLYPETARRTLEDMDQIFIQNPGLIVCRVPELTQRERPQTLITLEQKRVEKAEVAHVTHVD